MKKLVFILLFTCVMTRVNAQTGIGTTAPAVKLHVKSNGATLRLEGTDHVYMEMFPQGNVTRFGFFGYPNANSTQLTMMNQNAAGSLVLGTNGLSRMTIDNSGNTSLTGNLAGANVATSTLAGFAANLYSPTLSSNSYTLLASDNGKILTFNNASAVTLYVPTLFVGFNCMIVQLGAGQVALTTSSTTISNRSLLTKTGGVNAIVTILGVTATSFISSGDMSN
jgi:hypothetical protein